MLISEKASRYNALRFNGNFGPICPRGYAYKKSVDSTRSKSQVLPIQGRLRRYDWLDDRYGESKNRAYIIRICRNLEGNLSPTNLNPIPVLLRNKLARS